MSSHSTSDRSRPPCEEAARPNFGAALRALAGLSGRIGAGWQRLSSRRRLETSLAAAERLMSDSGDAEGFRMASQLAEILRGLNETELLQFLLHLADRYGPDEEALKAVAGAYLDAPAPGLAGALYETAEPRRIELLRRLNMAPQGTALIVRLREKALGWSREHPALAALAADMQHLLSSWFNRGFLEARPLNWDSPASVLESIIKYEAVHEIRDWEGLRLRLQGNRRCFGFFHPALPGVPLIFIQVALTDEMKAAVGPLLTLTDQEELLTAPIHAIFYSINNCHKGLKGINLGDLLIKQVVLDLRAEFPSLKHFATLSPIPGFRRWLDAARRHEGVVPQIVSEVLDTEDWHLDRERSEQVRCPLLRLCAAYLAGRAPEGGLGRAQDPVGRFHLSNGARLERINWLADLSPKGLAESCGMMVNYRYLLDSIEANHRAFVATGQVVTSKAVGQLLADRSVGGRLSLRRLAPAFAR